VDESGARTDLTRRYGRAPKGERVREAVPHGRWKVLTILKLSGLAAHASKLSISELATLSQFSFFRGNLKI
jgi:hypothetical protein